MLKDLCSPTYKVFGLVEYFTGRFLYKAQEGRLNSAAYIAFLSEVLEKTDKHLVIVQDGASYHWSKAVMEFIEAHAARITQYRLPPYSPDFNPIEKLWRRVKSGETHLQYFPTFEALTQRVNEALLKFVNIGQEIMSIFGFLERRETA